MVDSIFVTLKIRLRYIVKSIRLGVQIMIFTYFVGSYWYIFSLTLDHLRIEHSLMSRE